VAVYVIGCEGSGLVKIGHSKAPEKRLREISNMSARRVSLLWTSSPEYGRETETRLHQVFRHYRHHGEWFDFGEDDPVELVSEAILSPDTYRDPLPLGGPYDPPPLGESNGVDGYLTLTNGKHWRTVYAGFLSGLPIGL